MRGLLSRMWMSWAMVCLAIPGASIAADVSASDIKNVRAVIEAQLAAFSEDDATKAFSFATPAIRESFGSAENFLAMVRTAYPVVYRPASVAFLEPKWIDGELFQGVRMTDSSGAGWLAVYRMQQQSDKSWRINGCQVVESKARSV